MSARSRLFPLAEPLPVPRRLISQKTPAALKPLGATMDPSTDLNCDFMHSARLRGGILYFNMPPAVKHSFAADEHAVAGKFAKKFPAAPGNLPGKQFRAAKPAGPVGNQCAMRRTGDRIFRHAGIRGEKSQYKI